MCNMEGSTSVAGDVAELLRGGREGEPLHVAGSPSAPEISLDDVSCVAVFPMSGRVIATYVNDHYSLWRVKDGTFEKILRSERGGLVNCVTVCEDERLAALLCVRNAGTRNCLIGLEGQFGTVVSAMISPDKSRILTVDWNRILRGNLRVRGGERHAPGRCDMIAIILQVSRRNQLRWEVCL